MKALVCGSMAFGNLMGFGEPFADHILPDQLDKLSVSFFVPELRREYGGCAGNIAYAALQLELPCAPMATVGSDFLPYRERLAQLGMPRAYVMTLEDAFTAQAFITTDPNGNQITFFHPGAMGQAHLQAIPTDDEVTLGMVSPDGYEGMVQHADQFVAAGIPFVFDPGQALPMFDGDALRRFIDQATWVVVNAYECEMLKQRTGLSEAEIAKQLSALIVTRGADGSSIYQPGKSVLEVAAAPVNAVVDPTGCGDAYRAGLIYGLLHGLDWQRTGQLAALMGAYNVEHAGTQNYRFTMEEFRARYQAAFDDSF